MVIKYRPKRLTTTTKCYVQATASFEARMASTGRICCCGHRTGLARIGIRRSSNVIASACVISSSEQPAVNCGTTITLERALPNEASHVAVISCHLRICGYLHSPETFYPCVYTHHIFIRQPNVVIRIISTGHICEASRQLLDSQRALRTKQKKSGAHA
jgi:hypothetical protein